MERRIPKTGDIYRHFKGRRYKVLHIATCTETGEDMVIFETAEGERKVYASEIEAFLSPLDPKRRSRNTASSCAGTGMMRMHSA